jgi:hypothetical protein
MAVVDNPKPSAHPALTAQFLAPTRPKTTAVNATTTSCSGARTLRLQNGRPRQAFPA